MSFIQKNAKGILLCLVLAIPCWFLGQAVPVVGGPVFGILAGMLITLLLKDKTQFQSGITFVSKKVLQYAVILLGFGLNLSVILETGKQSLPIILATISTSLIIAYVLHRVMHVPGKISTLSVSVPRSAAAPQSLRQPLLSMRTMKRLRRQFPLFSSLTCWLPCFSRPSARCSDFPPQAAKLSAFSPELLSTILLP